VGERERPMSSYGLTKGLPIRTADAPVRGGTDDITLADDAKVFAVNPATGSASAGKRGAKQKAVPAAVTASVVHTRLQAAG
jgi:hypothetical protein